MRQLCCVRSCGNVSIRKEKREVQQRELLSFHRFPAKPPNLKEKWIAAITNHNTEVLEIKHPCICSDHFKKTDFRNYGVKRTLQPGAVPSIFTDKERAQEKKKRKAATTVREFVNIQPVVQQNVSTTSVTSVPLLRCVPTLQTVPFKIQVGPKNIQAGQKKSVIPSPVSADSASKLRILLSTPKNVQDGVHISSNSPISTEQKLTVNKNLILSCGSVLKYRQNVRNVTPLLDKNVSLSFISKVNPPFVSKKQQISNDVDLSSMVTIINKPPQNYLPTFNDIDNDIDLSSMVTVLDKPPELVEPDYINNREYFHSKYNSNVMRTKILETNLNTTKQTLKSVRTKCRTLAQRDRRSQTRIENLLAEVDRLKNAPRNVTSLEAAKKLSRSLPTHIKQLFYRLVKIEDGYVTNNSPYPPELKDFAAQLHSCSPQAYDLVRKSFNDCLPIKRGICKWKNGKEMSKRDKVKPPVSISEVKICDAVEKVTAVSKIQGEMNEEVIISYDDEEPTFFEHQHD